MRLVAQKPVTTCYLSAVRTFIHPGNDCGIIIRRYDSQDAKALEIKQGVVKEEDGERDDCADRHSARNASKSRGKRPLGGGYRGIATITIYDAPKANRM